MEAFEELILLEDHPVRPMQFLYRLRLTGGVQRSALQVAYARTLLRHPLRTAAVRNRDDGGHGWIPGRDTGSHRHWIEALQASEYPPLPVIDIRLGPGMELTLVTDGKLSDQIVFVH